MADLTSPRQFEPIIYLSFSQLNRLICMYAAPVCSSNSSVPQMSDYPAHPGPMINELPPVPPPFVLPITAYATQFRSTHTHPRANDMRDQINATTYLSCHSNHCDIIFKRTPPSRTTHSSLRANYIRGQYNVKYLSGHTSTVSYDNQDNTRTAVIYSASRDI